MHKPFRIPTLLGIFLIVLLVGGLAIVTQYNLRQPTEADEGKAPQNVVITNITDTGFTVTWHTNEPTKGTVTVTEEGNKTAKPKPFFDERHTPGNIGSYTMHSVPVRGLIPQTTYNVTLIEYEGSNTSNVYTVKTAPTLELTSNNLGPTYGSVVTGEKKAADGALVFLTLPGSQTLSAIVKPSGSFLIPLNLIRTEDLSQFFQTETSPVTVTIRVALDDAAADAITTTDNDSPVPEIMLGTQNDFSKDQAKQQQDEPVKTQEQAMEDHSSEFALASSFASVLGSVEVASGESQAFAVKISQPLQGGSVTSEFPRIAGTGIPDALVTLTLGMKTPQTGTTRVAKDGTWSFIPKKATGSGKQSVTMTTTDIQKKPVAITHLFEVLKSGTQVLGSATPSGTPAVTNTPTPTVASASPTPTVGVTVTPTPTVPTTGTTSPSLLLLILGFGFLLGGTAVFLAIN